MADRGEAGSRHPGRIAPATKHGHQETTRADDQHERSDYDERRGFVHAPPGTGPTPNPLSLSSNIPDALPSTALGSALPTATYDVCQRDPREVAAAPALASRVDGSDTLSMRGVRCGLLLLGVLLVPPAARAIDEIATEEYVADLIETPPRAAQPTGVAARPWAVLPEVGFGPDTGPLAGAKFTHRDVAGSGLTLDVEATQALERQQSLALTAGTPHLGQDRFLALLEAQFKLDPEREFFGLGNNDVGPDPVSTHEFQRTQGFLTFGWRPHAHLTLDLSGGVRYVSIRKGSRDDGRPFTTDAFRGLPGIHGGYANPIGLALVATTRDDVIRPTRGWRAILKVTHTNRVVGSDFQFTRLGADLGGLFPLFGGAHVLGVRANGGFIFGPRRDIPFWELEELGGNDTLRGFFPHRFVGTSRALLNGEYRFKLTEFDFLDWWRVRLDGVVFGEAGRVFIKNGELRQEFRLNDNIIRRIASNFRYSYGGGFRVALSAALVARIDVGFSDEERGLVYLEFGQTF